MKRINISDIGKFAENQYGKVLKFAVFRLDQRIKEQSPVLQGGFRANWQIGENKRNAPILQGPYNKQVEPPKKLNYQKEKSGNVYTLINPLPYAEAVTYGSNLPPSWGGQFRSNNGLRAGWPNIEVQRVANEIKRFKPRES